MAEQKSNQQHRTFDNKDARLKHNFPYNMANTTRNDQLSHHTMSKVTTTTKSKTTATTVGVVACALKQVNGVNISLCIDSVIIEEPLQISLIYNDTLGKEQERVYLVTMRTPGDDVNLVTGLLLAEGIIKRADDIVGINEQFDLDDIDQNKTNHNEIHVQLSPGVVVDWALINRDTTSFSSCGVCGKSSIKSLELRNIIDLDTSAGWLSDHIIPHFSEQLRQYQSMFNQTGGVHGCALFDAQGQLLLSSEDVGRHNALDKLLGKLARSPEFDALHKITFLSGRISFELIQKVLVSGISILVAVGAPSSLAINMAKRFNLTLIGFSRDGGFNIYHGAFRLNLLNDN
ncbi:formate dehydrogenase accessory sulfurtransferase FdhD [Moritella marina ATCC 15381]|uniref:Sulfur carrier protein FdhD n=1 Tax=Moritella marina ATCC 15381 TaxID=1202962 RepID=A0A5J6WG66_MORMI|nr:formate dehydrogenase accessory sulfurtransferase FdhD [Moritella marina]QFI36963.1 formate dehydrogenase accessory sulfurtransferase FdhD [Moritella marina ATCC 15381]